jgi:uncharacterized membrane protein YtjA (UPF0391 family)
MLTWAFTFLTVALIAAFLALTGLTSPVWPAQVIAVTFLVLHLVSILYYAKHE